MLRKISRPARITGAPKVIGEILLCAFSALLLFAAFPYFNKEYLAWFAFVPWFFAIQGKPRLRALLLSYLTGIFFWGLLVYWIIHVTLAGVIGLVMFLSLYFAGFGLIVSAVRVRFSTAKIVFISSAWVLIEFLRSHLLTGFPWGLLGYTQYRQLSLIQIAAVTGVWGISFLVMAVNICVYGFLSELFSFRPAQVAPRPGQEDGRARASAQRPFGQRLKPVIFVIGLVLVCYGYGLDQLREMRIPAAAQHRIAMVQGNVSHEDKWRSGAEDGIMRRHLEFSRLMLEKMALEKKEVELLVWSEAALPVVLEDNPEYFQQAKDFTVKYKVPLLLGAITHRGLGNFYNSALLLSSSGEVTQTYDKIHLVPFGEYVPLRAIFPFLETLAPIGELAPGREFTVFHLLFFNRPALDFSTLICFEDMFPEMARKCVRSGAKMLINITNDAWYRFSAATYQHCQAAVFRAVENRVPLVRCANTGVSCFIDAHGRITGVLTDGAGRELFVPGMAESMVVVDRFAAPTMYTRYGDFFVGLCLAVVLLGALMYWKKKK